MLTDGLTRAIQEEVTRATVLSHLDAAIRAAMAAGYAIVFNPSDVGRFDFKPLTAAVSQPEELKRIYSVGSDSDDHGMVYGAVATEAPAKEAPPASTAGLKQCSKCGAWRKRLLVNGPLAGLCLGCSGTCHGLGKKKN